MLEWKWDITITTELKNFYNNPAYYIQRAFSSSDVKEKVTQSIVEMLTSSFLPILVKTFQRTETAQKMLGELKDVFITHISSYTTVDVRFDGATTFSAISPPDYIIIYLSGIKFGLLLNFAKGKELELTIHGWVNIYWDWEREIRGRGYKLVGISPSYVKGFYLHLTKVYAEVLNAYPILLVSFSHDGKSLLDEKSIQEVADAIVNSCVEFALLAGNRDLLYYLTDWQMHFTSMLPMKLEGIVEIDRTPPIALEYTATVEKEVTVSDLYLLWIWWGEKLGIRMSAPVTIELTEIKRGRKLQPWSATLNIEVVMRLESDPTRMGQATLRFEIVMYFIDIPSLKLDWGWRVLSEKKTLPVSYTIEERTINIGEMQQVELTPPHQLLRNTEFEMMLHRCLKKMLSGLLYVVT